METGKERGSSPSGKGGGAGEAGGGPEATTGVGGGPEATTGASEATPQSRSVRPTWSVTAVRGKVTDRCLWSACKAMTAGVLLIVVGAGMATLGFYSDHLSTVEETRGNTTVWVKNESTDSHLGSLTYLGPVVMGVGGFTIVAACVMTFEARDTAAKIVPIWFRRTRIHVVSGGSGSTPSGRSSKTSWERFLTQQRASEDGTDTRSAVTQAFMNFSKYLQSSMETSKLSGHNVPAVIQQHRGIRKCPSEPNIPKILRGVNGEAMPEAIALLEASTPQPTPRSTYGGGLKMITGTTKPQLLSVNPEAYRQAVSMDCPRPPRLQRQEAQDKQHAETAPSVPLLTTEATTPHIQTVPLQASCTSSSGSMSVDIYLPQGSVTLRVHDEMRDTGKKSPLLTREEDDPKEAGYRQLSETQQPSCEDDFEISFPDFSEVAIRTPQIILDTSEAEAVNQPVDSTDNPPNFSVAFQQQSSTDECDLRSVVLSRRESSAESSDLYSPIVSPRSPSFNTRFSYEYSDLDSPGFSISSVISIPQRSAQNPPSSPKSCPSQTLSPMQSFESPRELRSPRKVIASSRSPSPRYSLGSQELYSSKGEVFFTSAERYIESHEPSTQTQTAAESFPIALSAHQLKGFGKMSPPGRLRRGTGHSPKHHHSLESTDLPRRSKGSAHHHQSPKRSPRSLDISDLQSTSSLTTQHLKPPITSSASLSSSTASLSQGAEPHHSPRKNRSESLPEGRPHTQAPSLKRFPLLRQKALDAFIEENAGSDPK